MFSTLKRAVLSSIDRAGYEVRKIQKQERFPQIINTHLGAVDPSIVVEAKHHLATAIAEMATAQLPSLGTTWRPQAETIQRAISELADPVDVLHYAQAKIAFDQRVPRTSDHIPVELYDDLVKREFPWLADNLDKMYENRFQIETSGVQYRGRQVSNVFFYHARIVLACLALKPKRILEIGGGYGALARLWLRAAMEPIESYVIVDLPESLFFSEVALRSEFGDVVGYFDGKSDPGTTILLVPPHHLAALQRPTDLVINTGSMQEMTDEWIDFYMSWLDRYDARFFYSINYCAQPLSFMGESRNLWSPRPSAAWSTRSLNINVPLMRALTPRDNLEGLYEKAPAHDDLSSWSHLRGFRMSREVYAEGLDLLRQKMTEAYAGQFLSAALDGLPFVPKELMWISRWLSKIGAVDAKIIEKRLAAIPQTHIAPNVG